MNGYPLSPLIRNSERKLCSPVYYFEKPPKEEIGICHKCKTLDILGSGLCIKCWDRSLRPKAAQSGNRRMKIGVEPMEKNIVEIPK
jgi:ribosomal protein L40E